MEEQTTINAIGLILLLIVAIAAKIIYNQGRVLGG